MPQPTENIRKLSKTSKFWIAHHREKDVGLLVLDTGEPTALIRTYLKSLNKKERAEEIAAIKQSRADKAKHIRKATADAMMTRNSRGGAIAMTQGASELGDVQHNNSIESLPDRLQRNVQKIRPE